MKENRPMLLQKCKAKYMNLKKLSHQLSIRLKTLLTSSEVVREHKLQKM